jgi:hypothetical protein
MEHKAFAHNERRDCSVKALALVTGVPYKVAHKALREAGRKARKGATWEMQRKAASSLGFRLVVVDPQKMIKRYPGRHNTLRHITTHHMKRFHEVWKDGNSYLLHTTGHVAAVVDGVNHDWTVGRLKRVIGLHQVIRMKAAK